MLDGDVRAEHFVAIAVVLVALPREILIQQLCVLMSLDQLCADEPLRIVIDLRRLMMPDRLLDRGIYDGFHQLVKLSGGQPALGGSNLSIQPVVVCACIVHHGAHRDSGIAVLDNPKHFIVYGAAWPSGGDEIVRLHHGLAPEAVDPMPIVTGQFISVRECCTVDLKLNTLIIVKSVQHSLVNCRCGQEPKGSDIPVNGHEIAKAGGSVWIGAVGCRVARFQSLNKQTKEHIAVLHI